MRKEQIRVATKQPLLATTKKKLIEDTTSIMARMYKKKLRKEITKSNATENNKDYKMNAET